MKLIVDFPGKYQEQENIVICVILFMGHSSQTIRALFGGFSINFRSANIIYSSAGGHGTGGQPTAMAARAKTTILTVFSHYFCGDNNENCTKTTWN